MEIDHFVLLPYRSDGVFGLPTSSSGNMDRVNLLLSSFLFFFYYFFFPFSRDRDGEGISGDRV